VLAAIVVGAGPAGIAAARALLNAGVEDFVVLDKHKDFGGLWDTSNPGTAAYSGLTCVTSAPMTGYLDKPMTGTPMFPSRALVADYLRTSAEAAGLRGHLQAPAHVVSAEPRDGAWTVRLEDGSHLRSPSVLIAGGSEWHPRVPSSPPASAWQHAQSYQEPTAHAGRRVHVWGGGNSAAGIAADLQGHAAAVTLVLPAEGRWFLPKHTKGRPADLLPPPEADRQDGAALRLQTALRAEALDEVGPLEEYGLRTPRHLPLETPPILGVELLNDVLHGRVSVIYADELDDAAAPDLTICAVGYREDHSPITARLRARRSDCYLGMLHPHLEGLAFLGNVNSEVGGFWLLDMQASVWAAHVRTTLSGEPSPLRGRGPVDLTGGARVASRPERLPYVFWPRLLEELRRASAALGVVLPEPARPGIAAA
jgi:cation diffusion facilitator CzcD-associated flavoprotein CzcO